MNNEITIRFAADFNLGSINAKLLRNKHCLTVAVFKYACNYSA
jgi:hypothetical protein